MTTTTITHSIATQEEPMDWEDMTTEQRKDALRADAKLVFEDDLGDLFVMEDCGGDLNVHLFEGDAVTFASLNPPEVRRLLSAVAARVAEYSAAE